MLRFFYNKQYKYTNRKIVDISSDTEYRDIDYQNIDSPDTINGHIIYTLVAGEEVPTYIQDLESGKRWYVSGITQLRTGKFQISLIRDIISESPELWKNEEAYIEAGVANDYNKYKRWNLPYTNTKVREERLNINGKSSFFVFYLNEQHINNGVITEENLEIKSSIVPGITGYDYEVSNLNEIPSYSDIVGKGTFNLWDTLRGEVRVRNLLRDIDGGRSEVTSTWLMNYLTDALTVGSGNPFLSATTNNIRIKTYQYSVQSNINNSLNNFRTAIKNFMTTYKGNNFDNDIMSAQISNLSGYVDKIIYNEADNKVYTIKLVKGSKTTHDYNLDFAETSSLRSALRNINWPTASMSGTNFAETGDSWFRFYGNATTYTYTLQELGTATSFDFNFVANQRKLPKSAVRCVNIVSSGSITDFEISQALMLAQTNPTNVDNTTGRILDIQYLPFSVATKTNENIKINTEPMVAQFLDNDDFEYETDLPDFNTLNKETDTIKVVSPSRASQYLFRPYDNDGNMMFNTKVTIKPYNSVIYVRPSTQGLLLTDWDDKDCLIIAEDFSLTTVTSQWTEYVYNNRNFQNAFERNIQGREFERSWERRIEDAQKKSDEWNARNISAQKAQTFTGNLPIISGIAGAAGTAWQDENYMRAAQLDREYNEALYQESVNIAREQFSYQLDNIKSQPQIPSKVTTIDCKFLDGIYLEYYSTNETELDAISNYYKYNGNRIDSYGTFADYYGWFVRGKIIISNNYTQPELDELNRRLGLGIFTEVDYA